MVFRIIFLDDAMPLEMVELDRTHRRGLIGLSVGMWEGGDGLCEPPQAATEEQREISATARAQ